MPVPKQLYAERFHGALTKFMREHAVSVEAVARLVGRPAVTVYSWKSGKRAPSRKMMRLVCNKFNWNYDALFSDELLLDKIINRNFLSFESLSTRYCSLQDPFESLRLVFAGGAMAFSHLMYLGLVATLNISAQAKALKDPLDLSANAEGLAEQVSITTLDPGMDGLRLVIIGDKARGLLVGLFSDAVLQGSWKTLDEPNLLFYFNSLNIYKSHVQHLTQ